MCNVSPSGGLHFWVCGVAGGHGLLGMRGKGGAIAGDLRAPPGPNATLAFRLTLRPRSLRAPVCSGMVECVAHLCPKGSDSE